MVTALVVALLCCQASSFHAPHKDDYYPDWPAASESDREPVWVDQKPGPAAASAKQQKPAKATASKATPAPQPPPGAPPPPGFPPPPGAPPPPGGPPTPGGPALPKGADKAGETKGGKNATGPAAPQSPDAGQPILPVPIPGSPILGPATADSPPGGGPVPRAPSNTGQPAGGPADAERGPLGLAGSGSPTSLKDVEELLKAMRKLAAAKKRQKTPGLRPGDPGDHTNLHSKSQDQGEEEDRGEETSCGEQLSSKDVALIRKNNDLIKEVLRTVHELKTSLLNSEKAENRPDKASLSGRHHHKTSHTESQEVLTRQGEGVDANEGHHNKFHHSKEQKEPENDSDWTKNSENANLEESQNHHSSTKGHKHHKNVRQSKETEHQQTSKQGKTFGDDTKHGNHHHREHTKVGGQDSKTEDTNHIQGGWEDYEEEKDDKSDKKDQEATDDDDDEDESDEDVKSDDDDKTTESEDW
ncbi:PREDICTED: uncharacterized protein DDB_G0283697-like [Branchiostoma belcheri]|uniref:Uncharacterized protein DDB_G0283697-like n=1 Tax=Branchiostoma belcheri TaxID=7741 RepID=A0A6P4YCQ3_BRABE|nr:PREDICTED: uncharacterized protein DDB_G0283697-like [Branchiostoma belcheri]